MRQVFNAKIAKKLLATLLTVAMLIGVNTGVFASCVDDYEVVSSVTERIDEDTIIVKTLEVEKGKTGRSFSGIKNAIATHSIYSNNGKTLSLQVTINASFYGQFGEDIVGIGNCSYSYYESGNHWSFVYRDSDIVSNHKPLFGTKYSKYTLDYNAYNGINHNDSIWISCDVNGNITDNGGNIYA